MKGGQPRAPFLKPGDRYAVGGRGSHEPLLCRFLIFHNKARKYPHPDAVSFGDHQHLRPGEGPPRPSQRWACGPCWRLSPTPPIPGATVGCVLKLAVKSPLPSADAGPWLAHSAPPRPPSRDLPPLSFSSLSYRHCSPPKACRESPSPRMAVKALRPTLKRVYFGNSHPDLQQPISLVSSPLSTSL